MVVGVVPDLRVLLGAAADDDALGPAVVEARGVHGVAAVVGVVLVREDVLIVAEVAAVLARVGVGPAGEDVLDDRVGLIGEGVHGADVQPGGPHLTRRARNKPRHLRRPRPRGTRITRTSRTPTRQIHPDPTTHSNQQRGSEHSEHGLLLRGSHA